MKTNFLSLVAAFLFSSAIFTSAATNDLSSALQKGLFEEEANHNLDAAIAAYQSVATEFDKDRKLAATAIFRLGEVYRKQGKTNEATAQYERIVKEFSDQTVLVDLSRNALPNSSVLGQKTVPGTFAKAEGAKPLTVANTEEQEIQRIKAMIKDSPDLINAPSAGRLIPLHHAAASGWTNVAEFLLANGADVNRTTAGDTTTALHRAIQTGNKNTVELLLRHGADIEAHDNSGATALHLAAQNGFKAIAEILLKKKADTNAKNSPANGSQTPLHLAVSAGNRAVVELLLANGANINARSASGHTPLYNAVTAKNLEMAKYLIEQKADVNIKTQDGWSPLIRAVDNGQNGLVELLVKNGADLEAQLPYYQFRGADGNSTGSVNRFSSLHIAAHLGRAEIAEALLAAKANPNTTNLSGATPLHYAASGGHAEIVKALLDQGAVVDARDSNGHTPLMWTIWPQRKETAELLFANEADPNIQTPAGETPLSRAKQLSSPAKEEWIALLLKHGANENLERLTRISARRAGKETPIFIKGIQPLNRYTLIELLIRPGFHFPDLVNVKIDRLEEGGKKSRVIPVNLEELLESGDCSKNLWLEWGDVVEIPELDHPVNESWSGYRKEYAETMQKCVERKVSISVKGVTTNLVLRAGVSPRALRDGKPAPNSWNANLSDWTLGHVVSSYLRASSDRSRIKVQRIDPVTKQSHEIIDSRLGLNVPDALWLIDGDQIEIPERDPNAPPAASDNSSGNSRTIPTRTLQIAPASPVPPN